MDIVNELTAYEINLVFKDTKNNQVTPASVSYRITDMAGTVLVPTTSIPVSEPTASLMIDATANVCTTGGKEIQERRVVIAAAGLAQIVHIYAVRRIK